MPIIIQDTTDDPIGMENGIVCGALANQLARLVGSEGDERAEEIAKIAIRDAVATADAKRIWQDRYFETDITFVVDPDAPADDLTRGSKIYDLPARFRMPAGKAWLKNANGHRQLPVQFLPRRSFLAYIRNEAGGGSGLPWLYTIQNRIDTGSIEVWSRPTLISRTNYPTMLLTYYAAIPLPNSDDDILPVGEVLLEAITQEARANFYGYISEPMQEARQRIRADQRWIEAVSDDNDRRRNSSVFGAYRRGF